MRAGAARDNGRRRPGRDDAPAGIAGLGAQVDDPVGFGHDVEIVLDQHHRMSGIDQSVQHRNELFDIGHVQPDRRFIEHVQRVAGTRAR